MINKTIHVLSWIRQKKSILLEIQTNQTEEFPCFVSSNACLRRLNGKNAGATWMSCWKENARRKERRQTLLSFLSHKIFIYVKLCVIRLNGAYRNPRVIDECNLQCNIENIANLSLWKISEGKRTRFNRRWFDELSSFMVIDALASIN